MPQIHPIANSGMQNSTGSKKRHQENTYLSVVYSAVGSLGVRLITILGYLVLAQFLTPQDFGLIAIFSVVAVVAGVLTEMGFGPAIVQTPHLENTKLQTAFVTHLALGIVATTTLYLGAPALAAFFETAELAPVLRSLAIVLFLGAASVVPNSLLIRQQAFGRVARTELMASTVGVAVGVFMAIAGWGVWSLVGMTITTSIAKFVASMVLSGWRPVIAFKRQELMALLRFGLPLCGAQTYEQTATQADRILIGKALSASLLGSYRMAFQIADMPTQIVGTIFNRVFLPIYSSQVNDHNHIRSTHLQATRVVAFFTFPALLGLCALSERFVLVVLGREWELMAPILAFLAVASVPRTVGVFNGLLYLSQGRTDLQFKVDIFLKTNLLVCIVAGLQFGLNGLLWGLLVARFMNFYPSNHFSGGLVGISVGAVIGNLGGVMLISIVMAVLIFGLDSQFGGRSDSLALLLVLSFTGAAIYFTIAWIFVPERCREVFAILSGKSGAEWLSDSQS